MVESTPDVLGGDDRIRGTRIPVWILVAYKRNGADDTEIIENYPSLDSAALAAAWAFYASYPERVDAQRQRHERAA